MYIEENPSLMKYSILNLGTLKVNAFEMIMGVSEELVRTKYNVDNKGQMRIGMNGLVVELGNRIILIDPGTATFLPKVLAETYDLKMDFKLEETVAQSGYSPGDITDVLFTHLHFDHGSGAFLRIIGGIEKAFPNAQYLVSKTQLEYINSLSSNESSSFFHKLLRFAGDLTYLEDLNIEGLKFVVSHGHTKNMMVPVIDAGDHDLVFASDLIPMELHMEKGAYSYYDIDPVLLEKERGELLGKLRPGYELIHYHENQVKR